jgi:hypothetical protein
MRRRSRPPSAIVAHRSPGLTIGCGSGAIEIAAKSHQNKNQSLVAPDCFACASRGSIQCGSSHLATDPLGRTRRWPRVLLGLLFKSQTVIQLISTRCLRKRRRRKARHQNDHEKTNSHSSLQTILRHRQCSLGSLHAAPVFPAGAPHIGRLSEPHSQETESGRVGLVCSPKKKRRRMAVAGVGARGAIGRRRHVMSTMSSTGSVAGPCVINLTELQRFLSGNRSRSLDFVPCLFLAGRIRMRRPGVRGLFVICTAATSARPVTGDQIDCVSSMQHIRWKRMPRHPF